jgi:hypothetical protein
MRLRSGRPAGIVGALAALAVGAGLALADTSGVSDPQGDSTADGPSRDLSYVSQGHSATGQLVHRISVYGELKMKPNKVPLIQIDTEGDNAAEYRVYLTPKGGTVEELAGSKRGAKAKRVDRHTMKYVCGAGKIGTPGS